MKRKLIALSIASMTFIGVVNTTPVIAKSNEKIEDKVKKSPEEIKKLEDSLKRRIVNLEKRLDEVKLEPSLEIRGKEYDEISNSKNILYSHISKGIRKFGVSEDIRDIYKVLSSRYNKEYAEYYLNIKFPNLAEKHVVKEGKEEQPKVVEPKIEKIENNPVNLIKDVESSEKKDVQIIKEDQPKVENTTVGLNKPVENSLNLEEKIVEPIKEDSAPKEVINEVKEENKKEIIKMKNLFENKITSLENELNTVKLEGNFKKYNEVNDRVMKLGEELIEVGGMNIPEELVNSYNELCKLASAVETSIKEKKDVQIIKEEQPKVENTTVGLDKPVENSLNVAEKIIEPIKEDIAPKKEINEVKEENEKEIIKMKNLFENKITSLENELNTVKLEGNFKKYNEVNDRVINLGDELIEVGGMNIPEELVNSYNELCKLASAVETSIKEKKDVQIIKEEQPKVENTTVRLDKPVENSVNVEKKNVEPVKVIKNKIMVLEENISSQTKVDELKDEKIKKSTINSTKLVKTPTVNEDKTNLVLDEIKSSKENIVIKPQYNNTMEIVAKDEVKTKKTPVVKSIEKINSVVEKSNIIVNNISDEDNKVTENKNEKVIEDKNNTENLNIQNGITEDKAVKETENKETIKEDEVIKDTAKVNENKDEKSTELKNNETLTSTTSKTVKIVLGIGATVSVLGFLLLKLFKKF